MKNIKYTIALFLVLFFAQAGVAQTSLSSYFLDGTYHNSKLNPAMGAERAYFSLLAGNLSVGTRGNVGLSDFLYTRSGNELTTFMSGSVNADKFLGKLPSVSKFGFSFDETLFSCGFSAFGGYANLGLSLHSSTMFSLPKELFEFAKRGLQRNSYDISGINMNSMNYAAFTVGYSREVYKGIRVGANLKYLIGLAHANLDVDKLSIELGDKYWVAEARASMEAALFGETYATVDEENVIDGIETGKMSPSSSGFAIDLGVVYDMDELVPGLTVSASLVDLGYINWKHTVKGHSTGTKVEFDGFGSVDYDDLETTVDDEFERLGDDAEEMVKLKYDGVSSQKTSLNTKMYLGAEYSMPFYKPLSVALLFSHSFSTYENNRWSDFRGYVNVAPLKWFEATLNCGFNTYGASLGMMLNFHPSGFNFFIGSDHMITRVSPQFLPVDEFGSHITLGVNIPIGKLYNNQD